jgi:hypothetical protein
MPPAPFSSITSAAKRGNGSTVEQYGLEMITALAFRIKPPHAEPFVAMQTAQVFHKHKDDVSKSTKAVQR